MNFNKYIKKATDKNFAKKQQEEFNKTNTATYKKKNLMTDIEIKCFKSIELALKDTDFVAFPQINLATIVNKNPNYQIKELFRNIDFGIFHKETFEPILMIELNDNSHNEYERIVRDEQVKSILKQSKIPLLSLFTIFATQPEKIKHLIFHKINAQLNTVD